MKQIRLDKQFKKDIKRDQISGRYTKKDFDLLKEVMDHLIDNKQLDERFLAHKLIGEWQGYSECHIKPNWLLIYKSEPNSIKFARLGTHSQLFKKF